MDKLNLFGIYFEQKRQEKKISLRELASKTGVSHTYLYNIEKGHKAPPNDLILVKLADVLSLNCAERKLWFDIAAKECLFLNDNKFSDVRCILLCKCFQTSNNTYDRLARDFREKNSFVDFFISLGEYDAIYSFKLNEDKNLLHSISNHNSLLTNTINDSVFYKPLYLVFPSTGRKDKVVSGFWSYSAPFFFVTTVHTNHCDVGYAYREAGREYIISKIDEFKIACNNLEFKYLVYYSLDLSEYVILWKTSEPADVLLVMQHLYTNENIIGFTNTMSSIPYLDTPGGQKAIEDVIGKKEFAICIQAVAKSYNEATIIHNKIKDDMKIRYDVEAYPYFSFGNYDYLCPFNKVEPRAFFELHTKLLKNPDYRNAILSLNVTIASNGYEIVGDNSMYSFAAKQEDIYTNAKEMKQKLIDSCSQIKHEYFDFLKRNKTVLEKFHWRKPLSDLLVLLDNMSKSTVFDAVCFLLIDNIHLFLSFLEHLEKLAEHSDKRLYHLLLNNGLHIEKFIREWEELTERVVRVDGTFQRTPGYEPLNYNVSASLVEYHNAYAQQLIEYFIGLDYDNSNLNNSNIACFVVPKMCRNFKTMQWFFDNREKDSMLFITIPMSQAYNPFFIMISLTHEIAHYCPNSTRLREQRAKIFMSCIAVLICNLLHINTNDTIYVCNEYLNNMVFQNDLDCKEHFLSDTSSKAKTASFCLFQNSHFLQEILETYCESCQKDVDVMALAFDIKQSCSLLLGAPSGIEKISDKFMCNIYQQIDDIADLFKEGYADVMMINVLSLSMIDYFKAIFSDYSYFDLCNDSGRFRMKTQRIIVVSEALKKVGIWNDVEIELSELFQEIDKKEKDMISIFWEEYVKWQKGEEQEEVFKYYYPRDILTLISEYLVSSIQKLKEKEKFNDLSEKRRVIRKLYLDMTVNDKNGIFSPDFQNILQQKRKNTLTRWEKRSTGTFRFE